MVRKILYVMWKTKEESGFHHRRTKYTLSLTMLHKRKDSRYIQGQGGQNSILVGMDGERGNSRVKEGMLQLYKIWGLRTGAPSTSSRQGGLLDFFVHRQSFPHFRLFIDPYSSPSSTSLPPFPG